MKVIINTFKHLPKASLAAFAMAIPLCAQPALATVSAPVTFLGSLFSYGGSVALVAGGSGTAGYGIGSGSTWKAVGGAAVAAGGFVVGFVDPLPATFYSGSLSFHYEPNLMEVNQVGWLGDWGIDSSLAAPSINSNEWDGVTVFLQSPANGLTASFINDTISGILDVSFDWGVAGKAQASPEPFNMLGISYRFYKDSLITYLGDFASPPADANLYISSSTGVTCTFPDNPNTVRICGEPSTSYFRIETQEVPGPLPVLGLAAAFRYTRRLRRLRDNLQ